MVKVPTTNRELAITAGILLVVIVVVYLIWRNITGSITDFFTGEGPTQSIDEDNPAPVDVSNTSYPEHQYKAWADSIYEAFNYSGSNWSAVLAIFENMVTEDDVNALINAYSVRTLYVFGIPTAKLNLPQTLVRESSWSWNGVEDVNEILASKGITFKF
jgi:hypothetical protein